MRSIQEVLSQDSAILKATLGITANEARLEVQMLLQQTLAVVRAYLLAHPEQMLSAAQQAAYAAMLQRRMHGEPIAYILGEREFFGLKFQVTQATLIPRPESELLVELALQHIPAHGHFRVLDLGTGSGALAIAIAHSRADAQVIAVDASETALQVARSNAQRLGIANLHFRQSDWFSALAGQRYDLIVSNPPYIAADDEHLSRGDVRFEPISALAAGADGLDDIRHIVAHAADFLERGAWLLLEHGYDQAANVRDLLRQAGYTEVHSARDIAGIERVSCGRILP